MHTVEPPPHHPPIDRRLAQPQRNELRAADNPMLPLRQFADASIWWVLPEFSVHMTKKSGSTPGSPPRRGSGVAGRRA
jgi:hypothetical protein